MAENLSQLFPGRRLDSHYPLQHFQIVETQPVKIVDEKDIDLEDSVE